MTLVELARAAGLSLGMMSKIENGIISASLSTLQALSRALGVPLTSLLRPFADFQQEALLADRAMGVHIE
ncbi:transcriptional regulator with XRE-family HTH domain [Aminobacter niigataensis]|uniref:Transcriptional regulator with XRE-family HTH domain n=1 Tax=Aminobacter niigataensis TaxID=83265 RepID=A0ABR6L2I3_9HYPH|nr:transcriptional regulator with XRE-family HTH domain [Aminobacter niigataensis]